MHDWYREFRQLAGFAQLTEYEAAAVVVAAAQAHEEARTFAAAHHVAEVWIADALFTRGVRAKEEEMTPRVAFCIGGGHGVVLQAEDAQGRVVADLDSVSEQDAKMIGQWLDTWNGIVRWSEQPLFGDSTAAELAEYVGHTR